MHKRHPLAGILLALLILSPVMVQAQDNVLTEYNIFNLTYVYDVAVSPDGGKVAYISTLPRPFSDKPGSDYRELYISDIASGNITPVVTGKNIVATMRWTPDGQTLAFLSKLDTLPGMQVYEVPATGGTPVRVTSHESGVSDFHYSPDGTRLAYTGYEPADPEMKELKEKGFDAEVYEEEWRHRNLYMMDRSTKIVLKLTKDLTVHNFDWHPDGTVIAAGVTMKNLTDFTYMFKRVYAIDTKNGHAERYMDNPGKLGDIKWSPDGRWLAVVSAADQNDSKEGSIFVCDSKNYEPFAKLPNLTQGFEGTVTHIAWKDNNTLLYSSEEGVTNTIRQMDVRSPQNTPLVLEGGQVAFWDMSVGGGTVAVNGSTPKHPYDVYTMDLNTKQLSRPVIHNKWLDNIQFARQEKYTYHAGDGLEIEGVLLYPLNFDKERANPETKTKRYPLIVTIHGGPEASYQNGWLTGYSSWAQIAAAKDFFVFLPNYRASTGRGVEFSKMGFGDLVGKEFQDVLDGIDTLIAKGYVDRDRVGIGGGSYGGYFSAWAATKHSERFAAACVFVGVTNQISKRHTTDIPWEDYYVHWGYWTRDNWMDVLKRSPVYWTKGTTTPTLILHGTEDPRVHPSQSLELYRTMKLEGDNPVRLIWYPGEGHGNRKNPARLDYALRTMRWFEYYLKGPEKKKWEIPDKMLDIDWSKLN